MHYSNAKTVLPFVCSLLISLTTMAQFTITGPACVKAGTQYHYAINRSGPDTANYNICIEGGSIAETGDTCTSRFTSSIVNIIWYNVGNGIIKVNTGSNTYTNAVTIVDEFDPGRIDTSTNNQFINSGSIPDSIKCSLPSGGNCVTNYSYQWQQSPNRIAWTDITNATAQDLKVQSSITAPSYYRRRVTETNSSTIHYSDIAAVYINIPGQ